MEDQDAVEEHLRELKGKPKNLEACDKLIDKLIAELESVVISIGGLADRDECPHFGDLDHDDMVLVGSVCSCGLRELIAALQAAIDVSREN